MSGKTACVLAVLVLLLTPAQAAQPAPPDLAVVRVALAGTWQSTDDTKFTRELDADGRATDRYEGDESATATGRWLLFFGGTAPVGITTRKLEPNVVYLLLEENGDRLLFALAAMNRSELKMIYLERGNLLSFVRLK